MKFKKIPEELKGSVVVITGSLPGVGKSYVKNGWSKKLREAGFRVFNCGTTWKASTDTTVHTQSRIKATDKFSEHKQHKQTNGFYFIDEAWIWSQERFDDFKELYPNMCFILFGDPLQFEPVPDNNYKSTSIINKFDFGFNLTKQYRALDPDLLEAIICLKNGHLPNSFIWSHTVDQAADSDLHITYTKELSRKINTKQTSEIKHGQIYRSHTFDGNKVIRGLPFKEGELYKVVSIDKEEHIRFRRLDGLNDFETNFNDNYFEYHQSINNHKIQGDTVAADTSIVVHLDSIDSNIIRHLYVAISRAQSSKQIKFIRSEVEKFYNKLQNDMPQFTALTSSLDYTNIQDTTSEDLYNVDNPIEFLIKATRCRSDFAQYTQTSGRVEAVSTTEEKTNVNLNSKVQGCEVAEALTLNEKNVIRRFIRNHPDVPYKPEWNEKQCAFADLYRENRMKELYKTFVKKTEDEELKNTHYSEWEKKENKRIKHNASSRNSRKPFEDNELIKL